MPENVYAPNQPMGLSTATLGGKSVEQAPVVVLPKEGDTIVLHLHPWGGSEIVSKESHLVGGGDYVICEVKSIKKATVSLE